MVEFLKDIGIDEFTFEAGKRYVSMDDVSELKDCVLVRQPNSPKNKNWWCQFQKSDEGVLFKTLADEEMSFVERRMENLMLQL